MKLLICCIALFFILSEAHSQMPWTSPIQLTSGNSDDLHPSLVVTGLFSYSLQTEWLAFSRGDTVTGSRNIYLLKSSLFAQTWLDTLYQISADSAQNDFPTLARTVVGNSERIMVVWQRSGFGSGSSQIWSRLYSDSVWGQSVLLGEGVRPMVAPSDTGFAAVWANGDRVLFCSCEDRTWSPPEEVTNSVGLDISLPQVQRYNLFASSDKWLVIWQQQKSFLPGSEILYSIGTDTGWITPGVVTSLGDNRKPRFHKANLIFLTGVSWESDLTGDWDIYALDGEAYPDGIQWYSPQNVSNNPNADDSNPTFQTTPIITQQSNVLSYYTAAAWTATSANGDSIALSSMDIWSTQYRTIAPGTTDRNPDISTGIITGSGLRAWVVWENNSSGHWKLYGVYKDIVLDVEESQTAPVQFNLMQNYPNPFNPSTQIGFRIQGSEMVSLKVFDILGREVAILVNRRMETGEHRVTFDAEGLPSGVYFYRLVAGHIVETKKMMILR